MRSLRLRASPTNNRSFKEREACTAKPCTGSRSLFLGRRVVETAAELELLSELGRKLDVKAQAGESIREALMRSILRIRDKRGQLSPLVLNRAQREYEHGCGRRNIVLKARQLGITTYIAARFFLRTITHPGTLTVQVAHDQRAAEQIFRN